MRLNGGRPSATALRVAMRRAAHQIIDSPKVLEDPIAVAIIGKEAAARISADIPQSNGVKVRAARFMRAFIVARSRLAEDELALAVARGVKQYVVLGAGLDTFAFRNPFPGLRVFEVDHPATQEWKRICVANARLTVPDSVEFAPADFQKETFAEALSHTQFCRAEPAFFSWLGVTMYLNQEAVFSTLRTIISMCAANGVVFDYSVPRASLNFLNKLMFDALSKRVAAAGEPFVGFFDPPCLERELKQIGYNEIENLDSDQINARYYAGRRDKLRVGGALTRLMCARGVALIGD